jgi:calcineurin-like phosphoesterase family protein
MNLSNILIYSDPHWGHRNMEIYCNRPKAFEQLMFDTMVDDIETLNSDESYQLICLGDMYLHNEGKIWAEKFHSQLPNNVTHSVIIGNHDKKWKQFVPSICTEVLPSFIIIINGIEILMSHHPTAILSGINIHGHQHNSTKGNPELHQVLISPEHMNYHIISLETVLAGCESSPYYEDGKVNYFVNS